MNVGRLNKLAYLLNKEIITNKNGFKEDSYVEIKSLRCSIDNLSTREIITAEKMNVVNAKKIICRYTDVINEGHFIKYKEEIYSIKSILSFDNDRYLEILIENIKDTK